MNISSLGHSAFKPSPSKRGQGCRKRLKGFKAGVLLLASGLFLTSLNASPSYAYNLRAPFDMSATDVVTVRLHTPSLRALIDEQMGPRAVDTELGIFRNDVEAVIAEINSVHNSALALEIGADIEVFYDAEVDGVEDRFGYNIQWSDIRPYQITIGAVDGATKPDGTCGGAWAEANRRVGFRTKSRVTLCNQTTWLYGTPKRHRENFWAVGGNSVEGNAYLRGILLHEMLHTIGIHHSTKNNAVSNHGEMPWQRTGPANASTVELLPDDILAIKKLYGPDPDPVISDTDISVNNIFFVPTAANQNSKNAVGVFNRQVRARDTDAAPLRASDYGFGYAVINPSASSIETLPVWGGQKFEAYYTVNNASPHDVILVEQVFISTNPYLNADTDTLAEETYQDITLGAGESLRIAREYTMPRLDLDDYYVIVRVVPFLKGTEVSLEDESWMETSLWSSENSSNNNVIPLRGKLSLERWLVDHL